MSYLRILKVTSIVLIITLITGCSLIGSKQPVPKPEAEAPDGSKITLEDQDLNKKMLEEYFTKLYSQNIEVFSNNTSGLINESIKPFLAKRLILEGNLIPDNGICYPRNIELNGLTTLGYQLENNKLINFDSSYMGLKGKLEDVDNKLLFFVRFEVYGKVIPNDYFNSMYKLNPETMTYKSISPIDESYVDKVKLQLRYEVELSRENGTYKVFSAKEQGYKFGIKQRLKKENNDYVSFSVAYKNGESNKEIDQQKLVIKEFISNLTLVDKQRLVNLRNAFLKSATDYKNIFAQIGIDKGKNGELKDSILIDISDNYKTNFDVDALPLKDNMYKINDITIDVSQINPHPMYTEKNRKFIVKFTAQVERENGIVGEPMTYNYDYFIIMNNTLDGKPIISSIKLNYFYRVMQ